MTNRIVILLLALFLSTVAYADSDVVSIPWASLSQAEQRVLKPFAGKWDKFEPQRQQRLQKGAQRWKNMDAAQRERIKKRFKRWQQISPSEREQIRERYLRFLSLPPERREHLRERYQKFQQLPPARRQELRQRWDRMEPRERRLMLDKQFQRHEQRHLRDIPTNPGARNSTNPGARIPQSRPPQTPHRQQMPRDTPGRR